MSWMASALAVAIELVAFMNLHKIYKENSSHSKRNIFTAKVIQV